MTENQVKRTIRWNIDRKNTKSNTELELRMLSEEIKEFWDALDIVDRIDAYCDTQFVGVGTNFKLGDHPVMDALVVNSLESMLAYMAMVDFFVDSPEAEGKMLDFLDKCYEEVIKANELKPTDKVNGKIIKGDLWYDPKSKIEELVAQQLAQ